MSGKVEISRELRSTLSMILNALDRDAADGKQARGEMAQELRALLVTPVVERQVEPVCIYWDAETQNCLGNKQPAPVAVVMPELIQINTWMVEAGWQNSSLRQVDLPKVARVLALALDKVKELNNG